MYRGTQNKENLMTRDKKRSISLYSSISQRAYNVIIGITLLWGFMINFILCKYFWQVFLEWDTMAVVIGYLVVAIVGIIITKSSNPIASFIGYNLIVLPMGVVLSICLVDYSQVSILNAFMITTIITTVMLILGTIFPYVFNSMGKTLGICLTLVIVVEAICLLFHIYLPTLWDIVIAVLFCGYIGYDWSIAQCKEFTVDNAIDSAVDLYLDIINLFVRVLAASDKDD